ncbi:PKD domain-containing protein [Haloplanus rubicundus]|uniref:PKD domain-containing protein n=1 Tax=Haloplanus rubicundus TaxID=1547898 RepID=A0A345E1B4_9EURY|nr:PKD domain-containing protein [Haloplanus rubicundus]AXG05986.1 PKD domain-containing protein [Haloplanus rubicundus]
MNRQRLALVVAALTVTATIPMTGAFSSVSADRTVSVAVVGDESAYLGLEPTDAPDGGHARISGGELQLVFDGSATGVSGEGLNPNAETLFTDVFRVTNRGSQTVGVSIENSSSRVRFHADDGTQLDGSGAVTLAPGDSTTVDIRFETGRNAAVESLSNLTIRASADLVGEGGAPPDGGVPGTPGDVRTNRSNGGVTATGTVDAGESVTFDLGDVSAEDNATVDSVRIDYTQRTAVNTTVTAESEPEAVPAPANGTVLRYLNVSHPETPDAAIDGATVRFVVPRDDDPSGIDLLRYDSATNRWETTSTSVSFVRNTSAGAVYEAQVDELSVLAVVEAARSLIVTSRSVQLPVNATPIANPESAYPTVVYRTYRTRALSATWWNERATRNADEAAAVIRDQLRIETQVKSSLTGTLAEYADTLLRSALHLSGVSTLLTTLTTLLNASDFLGSLGPAIQQKAVAIHVDPGTESYHQLRSHLDELEQNTEAYKAAVAREDAAAQRELLRERERLIRETYVLLPSYLDDVHRDVVGNAAGMEDPRAYSAIRSNVESLRMQLLGDYKLTTQRLYGASKTDLPKETPMPTHGWVAFGNAKVYDTMDYRDDYVVLRLDASRAVQAGEDVTLTVEGANVSNMEAVVRADRPDRPRTATGRQFDDGGVRRSIQLSDPEETMYVVVRADGGLGPLNVLASSSARVRLSVAERAGADIQRPHADLVTGPDPVTLEDGDVVYPTNDSETDLVWQLWDDKTPTTDIEYRLRVDDGSGFTSWTTWRTAPSDGRVSPQLTYGRGLTRVQLQVRDGVGRTAVRNADVVVSEGVPQTAVAAPADDESNVAYVRVLPDVRVERVDLQYRRVGNASWTDWKTVDDTRGFGRITVPITGEVQVRARATGLDGETGEWGTETLTYRPPDTTPPSIDRTAAPPVREVPIDGESRERRVPAGDAATLRWTLSDDRTANGSVEYRLRVGGSWTAWAPTGDGTVETTVPLDGGGTTVELAARDGAGNVANRTVRLARDPVAPTVDLVGTPPVGRVTVDGERRSARVTRAESASLRWSVSDVATPDGNVEYRLRVGGTWTDWRPTGNGTVAADVALDGDPVSVTVAVRDRAGNVANRTVWLARDTDAPAVDVTARPDVEGVIVNATADEPLRSVELQYRRAGTTEWRSSETLPSAGRRTVDLDAIGQFEIRARGIDVAGNVGPWSAPATAASLRPERSAPIGDGPRRIGSGDGTGYDLEDVPEDVRDGYVAYNAFVDQIDGELLLDMYVVTREGNEIPITEVTLTEERNQTVAADLPGTLTRGDRLRVDVEGNGTVVLSSARAIGPRPAVPTVQATPANVTVGEEVRLAVDPDWPGASYVTSYEWDRDGDGSYELTTDGPNVTVSYATPGARNVTLRVTDVFGATGTNDTTVRVNAPPSAAIAGETSVRTGERAGLNATSSADPDGRLTAYEWDIDDDGTAERTGRSVAVAFEDDGTYPVTLTVVDDDGATDTHTRTVTVENRAPRGRATVTETTPTVDQSVTFEAVDLRDPDGTVSSVAWDLDGDGTYEAQGSSVETAFAEPGNRTVRLRVTDDDGASDTTTLTIDVNVPPTPALSVPEAVRTNETATLDGSASVDPDGDVVAYELRIVGIGDGREAPTWNRSFADDGTYRIELTVTDDQGATATVTRNLTVRNRAPRAAAALVTPEEESPLPISENRSGVAVVGATERFDAGESRDPDGEVVSVAWDLDGDGSFERDGTTIRTTFTEPGPRTVRVKVTDDDGASNTTALDIDVDAPPIPSLSVPETVRTGEAVRLNGSASVDPDGTVVAYGWLVAGELVGPETATWNRTFADDGTYRIGLVVADDQGATATVTRNLTVRNRPPRVSVNPPRVNVTLTDDEPATVSIGVNATDADGTIRERTVRVIDPADNVTIRTPTDGDLEVTVDRPGEWTVSGVAVDDDGAETVTNGTVRVIAEPDVSVSVDGEPTVGEPVTLRANVAAADGEALDYTWFVDGERLTGRNVTITPDESGPLTVELEVVGDDGLDASATRTLEIAPRLDVRLRSEPILGGHVVSSVADVNASGRSAVEDDAFSYEWDLDGDGTYAVDGDRVADRPVQEPGTYTVGVRVTGPNGTVATDRETVTVASVDRTTPVEWNVTDGADGIAYGPDRVFVAIDQGLEPPENASVYALDKRTGTLEWRTEVPVDGDDVRYANGSLAVWGEGAAAVDPVSGDVEWSVRMDGYTTLRPTPDVFVVAGIRTVTAIDRTTGETRWSRSTDGDVYDTPVVDSGLVAYWTQNYSDGVVRSPIVVRDAATGEVRWRLDRQGGSPVIAGFADGALIAAYDGSLVAHDATNGSVRWSREMPNRSVEYGYVQQLTLANGTVFAATSAYPETYVTAITTDGTRLWTRETRDISELLATDGSVLTASEDGRVVARNTTDGTRRWEADAELGWLWQSRLVDGHLLLRGPERATVVDVADAGTVEWQAQISVGAGQNIDVDGGNLRFDEGTVYVRTGGGVYAVTVTGTDATAGALSSPPTARLAADT